VVLVLGTGYWDVVLGPGAGTESGCWRVMLACWRDTGAVLGVWSWCVVLVPGRGTGAAAK